MDSDIYFNRHCFVTVFIFKLYGISGYLHMHDKGAEKRCVAVKTWRLDAVMKLGVK